jgi:hypothetical protein
MRAVVAAILALALLAAVAGPHVHEVSSSDACAVCVLRHIDAPKAEVPDVAPVVHDAGEVACAPGLPPVTGAPLGAIPGQSPPAGA